MFSVSQRFSPFYIFDVIAFSETVSIHKTVSVLATKGGERRSPHCLGEITAFE